MAVPWFRINVDQRWSPFPPDGRRPSRYFETVLGETTIPSFSDNSSEILSSPQVGFTLSISRINSRRFFGNAGRPRFGDFQRQNILNPVRCQPTKVSGLTIPKDLRQSKSRPSVTMISRNIGLARRGLAFRSRKSASCFLRNRFSAISAEREQTSNRRNVSKSAFYGDLRRLAKGRIELLRSSRMELSP